MSENVLFVRTEENDDDPWDDTLLIKAYDAALAKAKKEVMKDQSGGSGAKNRQPTKWKKGQSCRAKFSDDGVWYEANIQKIMGDIAAVRFLGYGNSEKVKLEDLEASQGSNARRMQKKDAKKSGWMESNSNNESMEVETEDSSSIAESVPKFQNTQLPPHFHPQEEEDPFPPPPPPPPGLFRSDRQPGEDEALYAMLMSWYMSGYHTGYYEGRKVSKKK